MTTVTRAIHFEIKARRKRIVDGPEPAAEEAPLPGRVPRVAKLMALAIRFDKLIADGVVANQSELAHLAQVTQPRMTQIMNLLHLAPDIQEAILNLEDQPGAASQITERGLRRVISDFQWARQRAAFSALARCLSGEVSPRRQRPASASRPCAANASHVASQQSSDSRRDPFRAPLPPSGPT